MALQSTHERIVIEIALILILENYKLCQVAKSCPLTAASAPPFWFTKDTCLEHHVTKKQLTIV